MTTYVPFVPSNVAPPQFTATLDGGQHIVVLTWNVAGQRYYLNVYDTSNVLIFASPLVASLSGVAIAGMTYNVARRIMEVTLAAPQPFALGAVVDYTLEACRPASFNRAVVATITGASSFTFELGSDPGPVASLGAVSRLLSMTAGYFQSTLVFRNNQFEISP